MEGVARGASDEVAAMLADDAVHEEFPNRLFPNGAKRDKKAILEAGERGKKVMTAQEFDVLNAVGSGESVVLEVAWTGTLAVPLGTLPVGGQMKARFAIAFDFRAGKMWRMRNYDCFEPW